MQRIYFSDFFESSSDLVESEGFFNISLINDLPLFIDPFLIFCSEKEEYQNLHHEIIRYMKYLRETSIKNPSPDKGMLKAWYRFPEVKQTYLGFCENGNSGRGLGNDFAIALHMGLNDIFSNFGDELITRSPHLEKLCLIKDKVGKDNISDFVTNLIKKHLLEITQDFAKRNIDPKFCRIFRGIQKVEFDYSCCTWKTGDYYLPEYNNDFVLLTPIDLLVRSETWINKKDFFKQIPNLGISLDDEALRFQVNNYFVSLLTEKPTKEDRIKAAQKTAEAYPILIDHYIKQKEDDEENAVAEGIVEVNAVHQVFIDQLQELVDKLHTQTGFYKTPMTSFSEAMERVDHLKHVIEDLDGYRLFYDGETPIRRESDLHVLYKLACYDTFSDVNSEVNNGRGPVDFKVSTKRKDSTLVEFKLARTLKKNLEKQVEVYKNANRTDKAIKVIMFFTDEEYQKILKILNELGLTGKPGIVLIDARSDNKPSASKS